MYMNTSAVHKFTLKIHCFQHPYTLHCVLLADTELASQPDDEDSPPVTSQDSPESRNGKCNTIINPYWNMNVFVFNYRITTLAYFKSLIQLESVGL